MSEVAIKLCIAEVVWGWATHVNEKGEVHVTGLVHDPSLNRYSVVGYQLNPTATKGVNLPDHVGYIMDYWSLSLQSWMNNRPWIMAVIHKNLDEAWPPHIYCIQPSEVTQRMLKIEEEFSTADEDGRTELLAEWKELSEDLTSGSTYLANASPP